MYVCMYVCSGNHLAMLSLHSLCYMLQMPSRALILESSVAGMHALRQCLSKLQLITDTDHKCSLVVTTALALPSLSSLL